MAENGFDPMFGTRPLRRLIESHVETDTRCQTRGWAYLSRRTLSHARSEEKLEEHLELLRCHCNFVRPHGALKFGRETRTPAMQAGLATRRLTFREVFVCLLPYLLVSSGAITCAVPIRLPTAPIVDELLAA